MFGLSIENMATKSFFFLTEQTITHKIHRTSGEVLTGQRIIHHLKAIPLMKQNLQTSSCVKKLHFNLAC
ncbi:MAG: hypothetical protein CVU54_00385 [Deltaproteobacteria bacterium HGW-Deltaproteobacteria-12]|nr:MAG: hypothetical protein CVU54_00385 [Deltaproteobacteria bacterium HGW-Deltaproteobacteria-12]